MGKRQDPRKDEIEDLYGQIRYLRKLVKNYKREVARLRKYEAKYSSLKEEPEDPTPSEPRPRKPSCNTCRSTATEVVDLGIRKYLICKDCGDRHRVDHD